MHDQTSLYITRPVQKEKKNNPIWCVKSERVRAIGSSYVTRGSNYLQSQTPLKQAGKEWSEWWHDTVLTCQALLIRSALTLTASVISGRSTFFNERFCPWSHCADCRPQYMSGMIRVKGVKWDAKTKQCKKKVKLTADFIVEHKQQFNGKYNNKT